MRKMKGLGESDLLKANIFIECKWTKTGFSYAKVETTGVNLQIGRRYGLALDAAKKVRNVETLFFVV